MKVIPIIAKVCFGILCPTRGLCAHYVAVEQPHKPADEMPTCRLPDGTRPMFELAQPA